MNRNEVIIKKYLEGKSIGKLGKEYNISRQRIYQIIQNNGVYRDCLLSENKKWIEENKGSLIDLRKKGYSWMEIWEIPCHLMSYSAFLIRIKEFKDLNVERRSGDNIICTKCGVVKLRGEFHNYYKNIGGKSSWCKDCVRKYHKELRERL